MKLTRKISVALVLVMLLMMTLAIIPASAATETRTIYFTNNKNWSTVNAYYWGGSSGNSWPGTKMTQVDTDASGYKIFAIDIPADSKNIIFNNGSTQTVDITLSSTYNAYKLGSKTGDKYNVTASTYTPAHTHNWQTYDSKDATCTEAGYDKANCACGESRTLELSALGHAYGADDKCTREGCDAVCVYTTVYVLNAANWAKVNCYTWTNDPLVSWPGAAMTLVDAGQKLYSYKIPSGYSNVIFSNNGSSQSADLKVPTDCKTLYNNSTGQWVMNHQFVDGKCTVCDEFEAHDCNYSDATCKAPATCTICGAISGEAAKHGTEGCICNIVVENAAGWSKVYCYVWDTNPLVNWPGAAMNQGEDGRWYASVPEGYTNIIFNDGGSTQTGDLTLNPGKVYNNKTNAWVSGVVGETVYTVVGDGAICGDKTPDNATSGWETDNTDNDMTAGDNGIYTKTFTGVKAGTYAIKVVLNRSWDDGMNWGGDGESGNFVFTVEKDNSTVVVSFDSNAKTISIAADHVHDMADATCELPSTCKYCDHTEGEANGHSYSNGKCGICNADDPDYCAHTNTEVINTATCIDAGVKYTRCADCHQPLSEETASEALGHTYNDYGYCTVCKTGDIYSVVGAEDLCGEAWKVESDKHNLFFNSKTGVYSYTFENVKAGTYQFKVVKNHAWANALGGTAQDGNYEITVGEGSDLVISVVDGKLVVKEVCFSLESDTVYYLVPGEWAADNAAFGIYWFDKNSDTNGWVAMSKVEGHTYYSATVPAGASHIIFVRLDPAATEPNWDAKWNQSADLAVSANGGTYLFKSWGEKTEEDQNPADVFEAHAHAYEAAETKPTCVDKGYTTHTCNCGDSYTDTETEATGVHTYVNCVCSVCEKALPVIDSDKSYTFGDVANLGEEIIVVGNLRDNGGSYQFSANTTIQFTVPARATVTIVGHDANHGVFDVYLNGVKVEMAGSYSFTATEDTTVMIATSDYQHSYIRSVNVTTYKIFTEDYTLTFKEGGNYIDNRVVYAKLDNVKARPGDCQIWDTSFSFNVVAGASVTFVGYPGYSFYTISDGTNTYECTDTFVYYATEEVTLTYSVANIGNNYLTAIEFAFHTDLKHNEGKASTCTVKGYEAYYSCSCHGDLNKVELELAEHPYNAVVTAPTCTAKGYTTYTCTACGDTYTADETAALEHSYKAVITAPTCTATGYTTYTCERTGCGHSYTDDETEMVEHNYKGVVTAPTCTAEGYTTYTCTACGANYTDDKTEKAEHNYKGVVTAPTCTEKGYTTYTCSACGDHYVADETAAKGHNHTSKVTVQPGCTTEGVRTYTCACGNTYTEAVAARGHSEKDLPAVDPTCTETGLTAGKQCTACDTFTVPQETIPAKGHQYDDKYDAFCNVCNFERDAECAHTHTETIPAVAPTCTATGLTAGQKCTNPKCGDIVVAQTVVPATGHTAEVLPAKDPTCTETGLEAGEKCSVCGIDTVEQKVVHALGHSFTNYKSDNNATCIANGTETAKCDRCDATYTKTAEGSKLAHNQDVNVPGKAATCTEAGKTDGKKCSGCGATTVEQETIPAKGHSEEIIPGKAATCTETGLEDGKKCSVCGTVTVEQKTISAKGHTEETLPAVAPTCTATGLSEGKKCSVCDTVITAQTEIAAKGHTEETLAAKAPTCTETGLTEGKKCTTCGTVLLAQEEVPATGHLYVCDVCAYCYDVHPTFVVGDTHYVINDLLIAAEADYRYIYIAEPGLYEVTGGAPLTIFIWNESPNAVLTGNEPYVWNVDMSTYLHLSSFLVEFKEAGLYWIGFNFAQVGDLREFDINIAKHAHSFADATCTAPKTCKCGATEGDALEHSFVEGKCECGAEDPNYVPPHEHKFEEGKCACGAEDPNYVAPEQPTPEQPTPDQPAEELGFFEAIWAAIVAFFASIGDFFKNLFTPKQ